MALTSLASIVAQRINALRKSRGLSVNKLANMSGVPYSTVNSILREKSKSPTLATLIRIATALNMTILEFLDIPEIIDFSFDDDEDCIEKDLEDENTSR